MVGNKFIEDGDNSSNVVLQGSELSLSEVLI